MAITVDILVQPRASRAKIGPMHDGRVKIAVTAPPGPAMVTGLPAACSGERYSAVPTTPPVAVR